MYQAKAYAAPSATAPLAPMTIPRRDPLPTDVQIEILFCGICSFDFILDTVSADHDVTASLALLRFDGQLTLVGAPSKPMAIPAFALIMGRRSVSGSNIGGIAETQEMLDFCGKHDITADVEVIPAQQINEAYERLLKSDVKYRFSIDMGSLR